jgi:DnaJ-class molecular chaperone
MGVVMKIKCPNCKGKGKIKVYVRRQQSNRNGGDWGYRPLRETCPECRGSGRIEASCVGEVPAQNGDG